MITIEDVRAAAKSIAGIAVRTPLLASWAIGTDLWLKPENLQPIGAFKVRGAVHALLSLPLDAQAAGVITHSSGNHGQALAYAGRMVGSPVVVVVPEGAPAVKVDAIRALGAEVVTVPPAERESRTAELAAERGLTIIPPYDHRHIIAGQGTVGLEIVEDLPEVDVVLVPVGGGGLASGVATAVKALAPRATVIGVEPALAADAADSLAHGELRSWTTEDRYRTMADGLRTPLSELTFAHLRERLDGIVTVSEEEILTTVSLLARAARIVAEPSGAVTTAAYLHHREELPPGRTVAVVSGGNIDPALLAGLLIAEELDA
ncbi:threonine ammonia-lyase [Planosporangium mesophilum]|uniref:threonine ammonia-lyase n=1 Tax=Planosporangium mesophilum TaxID=689768 RepID=A0A8J3X3I6_9ACTN|nr:threonine/serine dehydratase [Planosporangium mesophilum]NJC82460.1 threonine/serine dehydratase [Planosporangium mesophilum]GII26031.1 serine/threonine dehydratase [Planosporangium mesophilum]